MFEFLFGDGFSKLIYNIWQAIWATVYEIWRGISLVVDVIEDMFLLLAGVRPPDGIRKGAIDASKGFTDLSEEKYTDIVS